MKKSLSIAGATCAVLLGLVGYAAAASVSVHEYPDHYLVEIDGSMDGHSGSARTHGPVTPVVPSRTARNQPQAIPAPSSANSDAGHDAEATAGAPAILPNAAMTHSPGYTRRLQVRQAGQITERMSARQDRWARRRAAARQQ